MVTTAGNIIAYTTGWAYRRRGDKTILFRYRDNANSTTIDRCAFEVVATQDRLYVGCRDGNLYTFSVEGRMLSSYVRVPGSDSNPEGGCVYSTPLPLLCCSRKGSCCVLPVSAPCMF